MPHLPTSIIQVLPPCAPLFSQRIWRHLPVLLVVYPWRHSADISFHIGITDDRKGSDMPQYEVTLEQRIILYGSVMVSAQDKEAALAKVGQMIEDGEVSKVTCVVPTDKFGWEFDDHLIEVFEAQER